MNAHEKITKAKAKLMLEHPYFGTLASGLTITSDSNELTFKSDGITIRINEEYIDKLDLSEVEFILSNGAMHAVLGHIGRQAKRDKWLWQEACDFAVNAMLVRNGLVAPEYVNYQPKFEGMYAEEIYARLKEEMIHAPDTNHDASSSDNEESLSSPQKNQTKPKNQISHQSQKNTTTKEQEATQELQQQFEQIFLKLKRQESLPAELQFVVPEYFSYIIDWKETLSNYIASYAKTAYRFLPPNMKYLYRGIFLPSLSSDLLRIVIAIDTSGSIDKEMLGLFLAEVASIMEVYPHYEIDLITADHKIHSHKTYLPNESLEYEVNGGGSTDFRPVFEYIENNIDTPTALLFFTDGKGTFPNTPPAFDTLWIMPNNTPTPFGEIMTLKS